MILNPLTEKQSTNIANNIVKCIKNNNINLLTKASYNFISISPGFIAHYDLQGFKEEYSNVHDFYNDIMDNKPYGIRVNYQPSEKNYAYHKAYADTYRLICEKLIDLY